MGSTNNPDFYIKLPVIENFFDASNMENYHSLPEDWYVAVTDIVNSSAAIRNDRYKTVNILGASPIVGILNIADRNKIPFTFGGDGSTFCIPPSLLDDARRVLGGSRQIGKEEYNLDLRAGLIPISYIRKQGHDIRVARYQASSHYIQAIFSGGGINFAEEIIKDKENNQFRVSASDNADAIDYSGLECRWQEVKQSENEVMTLLVKNNPSIDNPKEIYQKVLHKMRDIFGFDNKTNPIKASELSMTVSFSELMGEAKIRNFGKGWLKRVGYILKVQLQTIIGKILMTLNYKTSETDWGQYKPDLAKNSDYRKFDDMLRVVISGTPSQREEFLHFLDQKYKEKELAYGIHITDAAMITCMVFQYHRDHIHFVDGSGGGYVSASKGLKKRLETLK